MENLDQTEHDIDTILIFMNDHLEKAGVTVDGLHFNFQDEDNIICTNNNWDQKYFEGVNQIMIMACILHTSLHEQKSNMPQMWHFQSG